VVGNHWLIQIRRGFALAATTPSLPQIPPGTPPYSSTAGGPDVIDLANLNVHLTIPVLQKGGRGGGFNYDLSYDSSVWYPNALVWQPVADWGWTGSTAAVSGHLIYGITWTGICPFQNGRLIGYHGKIYTYNNWEFFDDLGTRHKFSGSTQSSVSYDPSCTAPPPTSLTSTANDGSGYTLQATGASGSVFNSKGTVVGPPINAFAGPGTLTDRNGNIVSVDNSGNITDTLGTVALVVAGTGTPSSPVTFTYTAPSGAAAAYTMKYTTYSVRTNFACSNGTVDYGTSGATTANLVSELDLPDGSKYTFAYEPTPGYSGFVTGRLASVALPTGGTISYSYSGGNNGINCADGSSATLTRATPDGTWTYAQVKGSGAASTTTVTDPQGNVTTIQFQGIYETQRVVRQGSGTVLSTTNTCYNAAAPPEPACTGTAVTLPITQRYVSTQLGGGNLTDLHYQKYDNYGNLLEQDDYDYGSGTNGGLLKKTVITYAPLGNITAFQQQVTVTDGSGHTVSQTNYQTKALPRRRCEGYFRRACV
jgi:hypothetical protein